MEDKLTAFYNEYVNITLTRDFVRILMFSGLADHTITDRFFLMLRKRLFPRLDPRNAALSRREQPGQADQREMELLMGLHGGFFYVSMRRWIYGQGVYTEDAPMVYEELMVRDRVRGYLLASRELFGALRRRRRPRREAGRSDRP